MRSGNQLGNIQWFPQLLILFFSLVEIAKTLDLDKSEVNLGSIMNELPTHGHKLTLEASGFFFVCCYRCFIEVLSVTIC